MLSSDKLFNRGVVMSMGSEIMHDILINDLLREQEAQDRKTWTTKAGEMLDIHKMETSHIKNVIDLCNRNEIPAPDLMYRVLETRQIQRG
jgi:hypothetical protein